MVALKPGTSVATGVRGAHNRPMEMSRSLIARNLGAHSRFETEELMAIEAALGRVVRSVEARRDILREGDAPQTIKFVLEGWVSRYKELPDGRRQILSLMIPGDICDANAFILEEMDHSLGAITTVRYAEIGREEFDAIVASSLNMAKALWRSELVTASIQREWTMSVGQRTAPERISHLFCEMYARLAGLGLTQGGSCEFPLTQADIGEATGLTSVHVNRTLQALRREGLVELRARRLHVLDHDRLREKAMFAPSYLHL
ncbi:cyclic nucleotide-binding protein [Altererythrobacter sp. B11]|uniref:Crp/Fnr family transcriptional regulator n=1 Tax=Altererythrobacter sp. B11 TaxID=2060312 RepID=UPI000DC6FD79|nr:Crp/Fnr family transcriptional regulator [Altererythrobacter sp. B11]BBC73911.1 cyclic nucleotide-binding protein [Altererythrobacter sp. B11]